MNTLLKDTCWALEKIGVSESILAAKVNDLAIIPDISENQIALHLCDSFKEEIASKLSEFKLHRKQRKYAWELNRDWLPNTEIEYLLILEFNIKKSVITKHIINFILENRTSSPGQEWDRLFYRFVRERQATQENQQQEKNRKEQKKPNEEPELDEETRRINQRRLFKLISELQKKTNLKESIKPVFPASWQPSLKLAEKLEKQGIPRYFTFETNVQSRFKNYMKDNKIGNVDYDHLYEIWAIYSFKNPSTTIHDSLIDTAKQILDQSLSSEKNL
jgi:hypothetical protein